MDQFFRLRLLGDPVLREPARTVRDFDEIEHFLPMMLKMMDAAEGVGLAAPQLGVSKRLLIMRVPTDNSEPLMGTDQVAQETARTQILALVNPRLIWASDEEDTQIEHCLSIPGIAVPVTRPEKCRIEAEIETGMTNIDLSRWTARIAQHELDHLDGVLILERASPAARKKAYADLVNQHLDQHLLSPASPRQGRSLQGRLR